MKRYIILAALAAFGCSDTNNSNNHERDAGTGGNGGTGGSGGGGGMGDVDMAGGDMVDVTVPPAPTATHVGATGTTCCMVAGATRAAYLLNPTGTTTKTGELHVVDKLGVDKKIDTGVTAAGFGITNGGKAIMYTKPSGNNASLFWADLTTATVTPKTVFSGTAYNPTLAYTGFFSPSGKYFVAGVMAAGVARSPDMHVIDTSNGNDVYQRLNGEFDYIEAVLPDDTMIFQDTAGGTSTTTPPVQTLYWISLPKVGSSIAVSINTRTASLTPTADNKTVVYLRTNGDLYAWDAMGKTGAGTKIAAGVAKFTVGGDAKGPVAYIGADRSVHVVGTDAAKLLDVAASANTAADPFGSISFGSDGSDVFYFQNFETQNQRGTLMRVAAKSGSTPAKVADKISSADLNILDTAILMVQNVDDLGQFGDAVKANRDGSNVQSLGMKVPVGGLAVVNPGPDTWFAMYLDQALKDPTAANVPFNGSPSIYGALKFADNAGAAVALDAKVHAGTFSFAADDGRTAAFVTGATWNTTAKNYVGALSILAARDAMTKVDGKVSGCSEVGPIVGRGLFVNAPAASPAGIYYVTF